MLRSCGDVLAERGTGAVAGKDGSLFVSRTGLTLDASENRLELLAEEDGLERAGEGVDCAAPEDGEG